MVNMQKIIDSEMDLNGGQINFDELEPIIDHSVCYYPGMQ